MTTKRQDNGNRLVMIPITWQFIGNAKVIKDSDAPEKGSNREAMLLDDNEVAEKQRKMPQERPENGVC